MRTKDYSVKYFGNNQILMSYLRDIRKYDTLTIEQENELMRKYKDEGDMKARDQLIMCNQRFVYSVAKIYAANEDEVMDYVNEGNNGLIEAIDKFDMNNDKSNRLITYAVWYIRREMNYYLNNTNCMIVKSNNMKIGKKVDTIKQKFFAENGRIPTECEIVEMLDTIYGISIKNMSDVADMSLSSINEELDEDFTVSDTNDFNEKTSSVNHYEEESDKVYTSEFIANILSTLSERNADIICMAFGIGYDRAYTNFEIGEKYDMDEITINTLKNNITKYLRQNKNKYSLAV